MPYRIRPARFIRGKINLPGDKSIAHRSIIISAIANGKTRIYNFPRNHDCLVTVRAFKKLGIRILWADWQGSLCVEGKGLYALRKPVESLFLGESGTTARLIMGILGGQGFNASLIAGKGLSRRPMRRVTEPLRMMGVKIKARQIRGKGQAEEYLPATVRGGDLHAINYRMQVASAQVKSALLLAALYARGTTKILESVKTRDHTERMLKSFSAVIKIRGKAISLRGEKELFSPGKIYIPGDISSAAFFIIAAVLLPGSHLKVQSVSLNPGRLGLIRILKRMGANIRILPGGFSAGEPIGDITTKSSQLTGIEVRASQVPQLIDELPLLMLAACFAKGKTVIYGVEELRVKETDRLISMQSNLCRMGADIKVAGYLSTRGVLKEKIIVRGTGRLKGSKVKSFSDHRTAMSMVIAGLVSRGTTMVDDTECVAKSFPGFLNVLGGLI
ncbi:3-phosphoshikimate 1-carboxyvinyltransferase [Candidatus Omnitrophota bacterium]